MPNTFIARLTTLKRSLILTDKNSDLTEDGKIKTAISKILLTAEQILPMQKDLSAHDVIRLVLPMALPKLAVLGEAK